MENTQNTFEQDLNEIENIRVMKARYCRYVDTKQWDKLAGLLAGDVHLVFKGTDGAILYEFSSRKDMISLTSELLSGAVTVHHVHNPEITLLSATTASAVWALEDLIIFPEGFNGPFKTMHGYGHYHERLEKTTEGWTVKSFILERLKLDHTY